MELYTEKSGKLINLSPIVSNINWSSHVDQFGDELIFDIGTNDDRYFPANPLVVGDIILLLNNDKELFRGIIFTEERNGRFSRKYTCFDNGIYLAKSKTLIQFNGIRADDAINQLLNRVGVPYGTIAENGTIIKKIYNDTAGNILKDILDESLNQLGKKYYFEMDKGKLNVYPYEDLYISGTFTLSDNVTEYDVFSIVENPYRKISIEDMRNAVVIEQDNKQLAYAQDDNLVAEYGFLQDVISIDKEDIAFAKNIAQNKLAELAKVFEDNSLDVMGDDSFRAGRIVTVSEPITGISGDYRLTSVSHTYSNGIHRMSLRLGVL